MRPARILQITLLLALTPAFAAFADDASARAAFVRAEEQAHGGDHRGAAKTCRQGVEEATDRQLKANGLERAAAEFGKAGLYEQEFRTLERLLDGYPGRVGVSRLADREYEIGDAYFDGKREPAFWHLRFVPWLTGPDLTQEIYQAALKRAPFAKGASSARLRLGYLLATTGKVEPAIEQYRKLIDDYPNSESRKYGMIALGELYYDLARRGDGDGRRNREALATFSRLRKEYPKAKEIALVDKWILRLRDLQSERLLGLARFYERTGRKEAATRYLNDVLKKYPDTRSANASEMLLTKLDSTYINPAFAPPLLKREQKFEFRAIPKEPEPLLIAPENSSGRFLLPIYDLRVGVETASGIRPMPPEPPTKEKK